MPTTFKSSIKPFCDDPECEFFGYGSGTDRDAVGIIMPFGHLSGPFVPAKATAHTFDFIGDDGFAVATAPEYDTAINFAFCNGFSGWADKIRVITRFVVIATTVENFVATFLKELNYRSFQRKSGMVGADGNFEESYTHEEAEIRAGIETVQYGIHFS